MTHSTQIRFHLRWVAACLIACGFILPATRAEAALIISVDSKMIDAGGTGFIDVFISSDANDGISLANYSFKITNIGSPASTLEFIAPQDLSENLLPTYLFAADLDPTGLIELGLTTDTFIGSDLSFSGDDIPLDTSPRLLARLDVRHVLGPGQTATQAASDQFLISLQNDVDTFFEDQNFTVLDIDSASFNGGLISINAAAAAIPEPSSVAVFMLAGVAWGARRLRRPKRVWPAANESS